MIHRSAVVFPLSPAAKCWGGARWPDRRACWSAGAARGPATHFFTCGHSQNYGYDAAGNPTKFYAFDERGNVVQRLDASGAVLSSHVTDAFGTTINNPTNTSASPFGFGGQFGYYTDEETGLVLCTHRYYSTKLGRWLTRDPIGYEGGINLYGFVTNNPIMKADPEGLRPPTDHDEIFVHAEIGKWQHEQNLFTAGKNHGADGKFDYKQNINYSGHRFKIHGVWVNPSQFGQYAAGYSGYYHGAGFGLGVVQIRGHVIELLDDNMRKDGEVKFWGDDGLIDKHLIILGAIDAIMDKKLLGCLIFHLYVIF